MADPDYATWLTKSAAAEAIGVSTKTLESMAKGGQLQQGFWRRPTGGPAVAVYHPADVARLAQERRPDAAAFVLPAGSAVPARNGNGHGSSVSIDTLRSPSQPGVGDDVLRAVFAAALRAVTSESSQKVPALFLTLAEASEVSGLSVTHLRRLIHDGRLTAVRDRGLKVRRRDLELL